MKGLGTTVVMVVIECLDVLLHTLTKSAINTGMSEFVYVFCSNALCFFFLLICSFFYYRMWTYLTLTYLVIGKMFLVGLLSCTSQILKHVGTDLSCPTLATAISDLTPAFAFIIPIIWRKKDLDLRKKSSQAKSLGTIISIAGALIVTLYGVRLTSASPLPGKFLDQLLFSIQSKWVIAGFILLLQSFFHALTFVVQSSVMREYSKELIATLTDYPAEYPAELFATMREYPAELIATLSVYPAELIATMREYPAELIATLSVYPAELIATMRKYLAELIATLFCCISMTIISAIVALIAEGSNPDAWQIKSNIELIAIGFNAFGKAVHLWAVRKKGPIYRAAFKPLRPVIAFIFGIIFQGETIYLGRVIGGAIASGGVFAVVIWGKAQEDEEDMGKAQEDEEDMGKAQEDEVDEHGQQDPNDNSSSHTLSLLQNQNTAK